jgi:hypothetical protein
MLLAVLVDDLFPSTKKEENKKLEAGVEVKLLCAVCFRTRFLVFVLRSTLSIYL